MNQKRHHYPSQGRPQIKKNDFSPKMFAKKIIPQSKKIMCGHSAQHQSRRKLSRPNAIQKFKRQNKIVISDDQVKNSALYKILQEEIAIQKAKYQAEVSKLKQIRKQKQNGIDSIKKEHYTIKLHIWELKDETMNLKVSIHEQQQQALRLRDELGYSLSQTNLQASSASNTQNNQPFR